MKLTLRKSERTWGVRSLVALAVMGAFSLTQTVKATPAEAIAEINAQLALKFKPALSGSSSYKDINTALKGALKTPITSEYQFVTGTANVTGQRLRDLLVVSSTAAPTGVADYVKTVFLGDAKIAKTNPADYPAGALNTEALVKGAINDVFTSGTVASPTTWSLIAVNSTKAKKFTLALAEQLFDTNYIGGGSSSEIQSATAALVKADKTVDVEVLQKALTLQPGSAADIRLGAFAGDTGGRSYLAAAAVALDVASKATIVTEANFDGKFATKLANLNAAVDAADASVSAGSAVASGTAVKAMLVTGGATYEKLIKEVIGGGVIAKPDAANQIAFNCLQAGTFGTKNWAKNFGGKIVEQSIKYSELVRRASNTITFGSDTFNGAAEAAAAITEQAIYAVQDVASGLDAKGRNVVIGKLAAAALKAVLKTDFNPGQAKRQVNSDVLAGAAVGGVVAVTGTGTLSAVKKPLDPLVADFNTAMLYSVVNAAVKAVKKNQAQVDVVLTAMAQAVGYIVGYTGGNGDQSALRANLVQAALDAKPVDSNKIPLTQAVLEGYVNPGYAAGLAGTAGIGAWGTRDTGTDDYYGTYWASMGVATGSMVTDISGL